MEYTTFALRAKGTYKVSGWSIALQDTVYVSGEFPTFGEALVFARSVCAVFDVNAFSAGNRPDIVFDVSIKTNTLGAYEMIGYVNSWVYDFIDCDGEWLPVISTEFEEVF